MGKKIAYSLRIITEGPDVLNECLNDVRESTAEILKKYNPLDLPYVLAGLRLSMAALEDLLTEPGRALMNMIIENSQIISVKHPQTEK